MRALGVAQVGRVLVGPHSPLNTNAGFLSKAAEEVGSQALVGKVLPGPAPGTRSITGYIQKPPASPNGITSSADKSKRSKGQNGQHNLTKGIFQSDEENFTSIKGTPEFCSNIGLSSREDSSKQISLLSAKLEYLHKSFVLKTCHCCCGFLVM